MKNFFIITVILLFLVFIFYFFYKGYEKSVNSDIKENQSVEKDNSKTIKIIAIGDSLTAGYGVSYEDSYPKVLEKRLKDKGISVQIINSGISGETTTGLLNRVDFIKSQKPDIVLITIGGNDVFRNIPQSQINNNIKDIITNLKQDIKPENIYLMQIQAPSNFGKNYSKSFGDMYINLAKDYKIKSPIFVTEEVFLNPNLMLSDGIHPNKKGYEFIVDNYIFEQIYNTLKK